MELKRVSLVLADISGYTQFTRNHKTTLLHAEHIITELLEAVIDKAEYPLTISKIEGDAVFMYALAGEDDAATARDVLQQVRQFFEAFNRKAHELIQVDSCTCEACATIAQLKLKAVLHHGEVAFKRIRQFEELAGEDVILAHRLIKNSVPSKEYLLLTERFHKLSGGIPDQEADLRTEQPEGLGKARVAVYYVDPAEFPAAPAPSPLARFWFMQGLILGGLLRRIGLRREGRAFSNLPQIKPA